MLHLHNQTANIYSHLFGLLLFIVFAISTYGLFQLEDLSFGSGDVYVILFFFVGVIMCLSFSTYYHIIANHSYKVHDSWLIMDFFGIICLITGTFVPLSFYTFYCHPKILYSCWTLITPVIITCSILCIKKEFRTPPWRRTRGVMFFFFGTTGFFPLFYSIHLLGFQQAKIQMGWSWFNLGGIFYISGVFIYSIRFPEHLMPGTFDIWGHSHQLFHVLVVLGAASHFYGIMTGFHYFQDAGLNKCHEISLL